MPLNKEDIFSALRVIRDRQADKDIVDAGIVTKVAICDNHASVTIAAPDHEQTREHLRTSIETALRRFAAERAEKLASINIQFTLPTADSKPDIPLKQASSSKTTSKGQASPGTLLPAVTHIIAVGAGKGGVGKSTVSVNLAVALARKGHAVGLLDGDIYGPSAPTLLGLDAEEVLIHENKLQVFNLHGIKAMTIGKLVDPERPLIWRGPMAHGAFKQLVEQTAWGELDYLIVDLPPGTGDVPLTMSQLMTLTGAVVVCTPQKVAQDDAVRAVRMFQQLEIDVLGIVENMSFFIGDDGKEYDIFGRGGAELMAQRLGLPYLGAIPITMALRENSDHGTPTANFSEENPALRKSLEDLAKRVEDEVALASLRRAPRKPTLSVS